MWNSVSSNFHGFSRALEGEVAWMCCDSEGKVTTGVGDLIEPAQAALDLRHYGAPWSYREQLGLASDADVSTDWMPSESLGPRSTGN